MAYLLEAGHIHVAEVMVYTRAFDDAIDVVLMRSKAEAELERLKSDAARLAALHTALTASSARPAGSVTLRVLLAPTIGSITGTPPPISDGGHGHGRVLRLHGVGFSRGAASVAMDALDLQVPGVYAIVGPNGVGKSSLFALLGACQEALEAEQEHEEAAGAPAGAVVTVLPAGLQLTRGGGAVTLPRAGWVEGGFLLPPSIVEVGQRAYTPLHVRPIDWLMNTPLAAATQRGADAAERAAAARVAALAVELRLGLGERSEESDEESGEGGTASGKGHGSVGGVAPSDDSGGTNDDPFVASLLREHEDWGGAMSGGQRVKLELIRSVFLRGSCPDVLLLDEAFAPLDPSSKLLIMRRLRTFCSTSLVLVIYHANTRDMGTGQAEAAALGSADAIANVCSEAGGTFFDGVVQFSDDGNATFDPTDGRCT